MIDGVITEEQIRDEVRRCKDVINGTGFKYFCENYITISHKTKGSVKWADGHMYQWQRDAALGFLKDKFFISRKVRQIGFSTLTGAYALWRAVFFQSQSIVVISIGQKESTEYLSNVKFMYRNLPKWLKPKAKMDAATAMQFQNNSKITSLPNTPSVGRSLSGSMIILDEFGFYGKRAKSILGSATPGLGTGLLTPFTNKTLPAQLFVISTLPDETEDGGNEYLRLLHGTQDKPEESRFRLIDVDVSDIPEHQDPEWHAIMKELLGPGVYEREILAEEISMFDDTYIPSEYINKINIRQPIRTDFISMEDVDDEGLPLDLSSFDLCRDEWDKSIGYAKGLWIWHDPIPGAEYGIACDVAKGVAGDASAFHVFDLETMEQVAEYRNNQIPLPWYKEIIRAVAEYYNEALLSTESTGIGEGMAADFGQDYENMYFHKSRGKTYSPGFPMSPKNRPNALAAMQRHMMDKEDSMVYRIHSIRTANELKRFTFHPNGKIMAKEGFDDLTMALCQFCYLVDAGFFVSQNLIEKEFSDDYWEKKNKEEELKQRSHFLTEGIKRMGINYNNEVVDVLLEHGSPEEKLGIPRDALIERKTSHGRLW